MTARRTAEGEQRGGASKTPIAAPANAPRAAAVAAAVGEPVAAPDDLPRCGPWRAFRRAHLFDYPPPAIRLWLALACCGGAALAVAIVQLARLAPEEIAQVLGWVAIAAVAAAFPLQIPRSKYSIATGDLVVFLLLALHGTAAAVLAAALEALVACIRTSGRLSSRIASFAAAGAAMTLAGWLFDSVEAMLVARGVAPAATRLAALALTALVYLAASSTVLMQIVCLKRGRRLTFPEWLASTSWVGTLYLVSAMVAGLMSEHARQSGGGAAALGVLIIAGSLALLRVHFRQQSAEHEAQEARVAAAQLEAEQNQRRFHAAFTHASIGMAIVAADGIVVQVNDAFCTLLAYPQSNVLGRPFLGLLHPGDAALLERHVAAVVAEREASFSIELRCLGADRREIWVSLHCALFDDGAAAGGGLIFQLHDITSRRRAEGELHHIAYHDSLTDLANRNCFQERLAVAVERSRTDRRFCFAVMYLDLDRFKIVNDSLGHPAGDELLKEVGVRLRACVRPCDLVARLGGDEFALLLEDTPAADDVLRLGRRLLEALEQPVVINRTEVRPRASIGVTFSDLGYRETNEILRDADIAMYKAKADGKGRLAVFDASLHRELGHRLQLEADLRRAIGEGKLSLAFQPLFDLAGRRINGFEALARWTHPGRGSISPAVFIALAEETGCIEALTSWALDEAVRQLAAWRRESAAFGDLVVHVNVSGKDLCSAQFVAGVRDTLQRHDVPAHLLTLEITESTLMAERERALCTLADLVELGVGLAIDDFGTGYSSLAYLSTLPFDCLKIDRSFVMGMEHSAENVEIVRTVISLARTLNKRVIAEGIETDYQLARLREMGAPFGQGYLLAPPLDARRASARLQAAAAVEH